MNRSICTGFLRRLGRLTAKSGVYVILGNHDCKQDLPTLRTMLSDLGLVYVGGRFEQVKIRGERILIAGNELPWVPPAADLEYFPSPRPVAPFANSVVTFTGSNLLGTEV